ncbi:hypothetical protein ACIRBZ_45095 [Streptomyces sp. NPDC094038]|uniref:hypothetical protein n=1 Tax=Streptomyces sp. NPDC094038 TaxID=3366055 RepID=UPI003806EC0D
MAALYQKHWEAEAVFAELKTHQRGARVVITSKTPDGILQQIWATCWSTTRCASWWSEPPPPAAWIPTRSPSPKPCAPPGAA